MFGRKVVDEMIFGVASQNALCPISAQSVPADQKVEENQVEAPYSSSFLNPSRYNADCLYLKGWNERRVHLTLWRGYSGTKVDIKN